MIIGIGIDLCDIRRIEKSLDRFGDHFTYRIFTKNERTKAERRAHPASSYAQGFAAKEACAKALGTGFRRGVFWADIGVDNLPSGKPFLTLSGGAQRRLEELTPPSTTAQIDISLTDESFFAQAMVLILAVPNS